MNDDLGAHYGQDGLAAHILHEFTQAGYTLADLQPGDLAGVDEFHLGGRMATDALLGELDLTSDSRLLDVGSGIGGAARTAAAHFGCSVTGVDLTPEFVETAQELSRIVGMDATTTFERANALDLPFADGDFDAVLLLHVGMNISDKHALMAELGRVVRPGGSVVVYDIMRTADGDVSFPVPWSSSPSTSFLATPNTYRDALAAAGLEPGDAVDQRNLVGEALRAASQNPPKVNLSHLMGHDWPTMFANLRAALGDGIVAPTRIIATRPATH